MVSRTSKLPGRKSPRGLAWRQGESLPDRVLEAPQEELQVEARSVVPDHLGDLVGVALLRDLLDGRVRPEELGKVLEPLRVRHGLLLPQGFVVAVLLQGFGRRQRRPEQQLALELLDRVQVHGVDGDRRDLDDRVAGAVHPLAARGRLRVVLAGLCHVDRPCRLGGPIPLVKRGPLVAAQDGRSSLGAASFEINEHEFLVHEGTLP